MKNAFLRMGRTCAFLTIIGGLMAGALSARSGEIVTLNLPHAVTVGSITLPIGEYTISTLDMADGEPVFIVRCGKGQAVTLQAQRVESVTPAEKTEVLFSAEGNTWHFDKLLIGGESEGYEFESGK